MFLKQLRVIFFNFYGILWTVHIPSEVRTEHVHTNSEHELVVYTYCVINLEMCNSVI